MKIKKYEIQIPDFSGIKNGDIINFDNVNHQFVSDNNPHCGYCSLNDLCNIVSNTPCGKSVGTFKRVYDENKKR